MNRDTMQVVQATRLIRAKGLNHNELRKLNELLPVLLELVKSGDVDLLEFKVVCEGLAKPQAKPKGGHRG